MLPDGHYLFFDCFVNETEVSLNSEFVDYAWVKINELPYFDLNEATILTFKQKGWIN
jgi:nucleoside triphosphatase